MTNFWIITLALVLIVRDLRHPLDGLAIESFGDRDMRHAGGSHVPMPVLDAWRNPHHVARSDFLHRVASLLDQTDPAVMINVWPSGCVCQAVRAPGSNVTTPPLIRAGALLWNRESTGTEPVKFSAEPVLDGGDEASIHRDAFAAALLRVVAHKSKG